MRGRSGWTAAAIAAAVLGFAGAAEAKTFEVTRANDPNPGKCKRNDCSLREAVLAANERQGRDAIVLPDGRYKLTRANPGGVSEDLGVTGDLDINNDPLTLKHPGRGKARINANELDRAIHIQAGAGTVLKRIAISGGLDDDGGGILTLAPLRLVRSSVGGSTATNDGGGIDAQGIAPVRLIRSTIRNNSAEDDGGALNGGEGAILARNSVVSGNESGDEGGGIRTTAAAPSTTVLASTIAGNTAGSVGGGVEVESAVFLMRDSTVSGNRAGTNGGGLSIPELDLPVATIVNSTIAGNGAVQNGGGIYAAEGAEVNVNAVTVARNIASSNSPGPPPITGGGIYMIDSTFEVRNSLLALNEVGQGGLVANDCEGETFTSLGNNVISTKFECDGFTQPTDLERPNPKIGQLSKNGGPTKTVALKRGSPAIGHAHNPSAPNRDQRGERRGGDPDAGAFER